MEEESIIKYQVTFWQQFILLIRTVLIWPVLFYIHYLSTGDFLPRTYWIIIFSFVFITDALPTLILHIQYYRANGRMTLYIDPYNNRISIQKNDLHEYYLSELTSLTRFGSFAEGPRFTFGDYRFYRLQFSDGSKYDITCLMINNIEGALEKNIRLKTERKNSLMALIRK